MLHHSPLKRLSLVLSLCFLSLSTAPVWAQESSGGENNSISTRRAEVYDQLNARWLLQLMKSEGYPVSIDEDGDVAWKINGYNTYIMFDKDGGAMQFFAGVNTDYEVPLAKINAWNLTRKYSRSYLNEKGRPYLEAEMSFEGGVTRAHILSFLKLCSISFTTWIRETVAE